VQPQAYIHFRFFLHGVLGYIFRNKYGNTFKLHVEVLHLEFKTEYIGILFSKFSILIFRIIPSSFSEMLHANKRKRSRVVADLRMDVWLIFSSKARTFGQLTETNVSSAVARQCTRMGGIMVKLGDACCSLILLHMSYFCRRVYSSAYFYLTLWLRVCVSGP
jgi:hypothetical protein